MKGMKVRIIEVGPRDGLQNEKALIPVETKIAFVDGLSEAGFDEIEAGAFVSPKSIPQLADSERVFKEIRRRPGVAYAALVPNEKGFERALASRADKIAVFTAASETFNQRNINASIEESIERFRPVVTAAKGAKLPVRGYVSTSFHCPFEGPIPPQKVIDVCRRLLSLGVDELSIGDTIGKAEPDEVRRLLEVLLPESKAVALHFHDTYGRAVENALTAWKEFGVSAFDASAGGIGGCPYAPGATGNVSTETLALAFLAAGAELSVRPDAVATAARIVSPYLGHGPLGKKT
jgi:hydroxymethylglutaryl-CoA lyase